QVAERLRMAGRGSVQDPEYLYRRALERTVAGERVELQQRVRGRRAPRRDRVLLEASRSHDQGLVVGGGVEEAAALFITEPLTEVLGQAPRLDEPACLERRLVQREQRLGEK